MQPLSSTSRTMKIGLSSERYSLIELSSLVRHKIRPRLLRVPVWRTSVSGETAASGVMCSSIPPRRHGVSVDQVLRVTADALDAPLLKHSPGSIVGTRRLRRHAEPADRHPARPARGGPREPCRGRVHRAEWTAPASRRHRRHRDRPSTAVGDAVVNDGPGLLLIVEKFPSANTLEVTRESRKRSTRCGPG